MTKRFAEVEVITELICAVLIVLGLIVIGASATIMFNPELVVGTISNANAIELANHAAKIEDVCAAALHGCGIGVVIFAMGAVIIPPIMFLAAMIVDAKKIVASKF